MELYILLITNCEREVSVRAGTVQAACVRAWETLEGGSSLSVAVCEACRAGAQPGDPTADATFCCFTSPEFQLPRLPLLKAKFPESVLAVGLLWRMLVWWTACVFRSPGEKRKQLHNHCGPFTFHRFSPWRHRLANHFCSTTVRKAEVHKCAVFDAHRSLWGVEMWDF